MARTVRTVKDQEGNDIEVYSDSCNECGKEMIFPKAEADKIESIFPFVAEKVAKGTPCFECAKIQIENGTFKLYSEEEMKIIKEKINSSSDIR